ncbi:MAG: DNA replication/repair protein RecF [Pseudomonadota bacterium]
MATATPWAQTTGAPVALTELKLTDYRGYTGLRLAVETAPVVLTGPNGAGKTNLLEAISYLSPGRGLRGAKLGDLARLGSAGTWAVAATVATPAGPVRVGTGADPDGESERRVVRIDGETQRGQSGLAEVMGLVWLTPAMDGLFRESASGRRRFFDRIVYGHDPLHARRIGAYERAMRERARLLREGGRDPVWLGALEETMAENGIAVAAARREVAARLAGELDHAAGPFPGAHLDIDGTLEKWLATMPAVEAEHAFQTQLAESRPRDAETGGAADGPHKSDLAVHHGDTGVAADLCSTGQQKALVIAILLASARLEARRRPPVMLLDDVAAHLDDEHRNALFDEILTLGLQVWMSGTDEDQFGGLTGRAQFFRVNDADVAPGDQKGPLV